MAQRTWAQARTDTAVGAWRVLQHLLTWARHRGKIPDSLASMLPLVRLMHLGCVQLAKVVPAWDRVALRYSGLQTILHYTLPIDPIC